MHKTQGLWEISKYTKHKEKACAATGPTLLTRQRNGSLEKGRPLAQQRTPWTSRRPQFRRQNIALAYTLALTSSTVNGIQMRYSFINTMVRPVIAAVVVDDTMTVPAIALQRTRRAATVERSCSCCCYGGRRRSRCCCFSCSCGDRTGQAVEFAGIRTGRKTKTKRR